jgi:hypothetical protein
LQKKKPHYINWYTPENLKEREMPPLPISPKEPLAHFDDYWLEYYRPLALSTLSKVFSCKMKSTIPYAPYRLGQVPPDLSPFVRRVSPDQIQRHHPPQRSVKIQEPSENRVRYAPSTPTIPENPSDWSRQPPSSLKQAPSAGIIKEPAFELNQGTHIPPINAPLSSNTPSKALIAQWTLGQLVTDSLNPSVTANEAEEYEMYINHPLKVPLVVTSENTDHGFTEDMVIYANNCNVEEAVLEARAGSNIDDYAEFLTVSEEGLTVVSEDYEKKRYKRYRQWLRGKSLFKQRVDV